MPEEIDDTTAAEVGHALIRWLTDEDPAGVARFVPGLAPVDDARATRLGQAVVSLLQQLDVA
ncbi:MAG: hypothetical protein M3R48_03725 [Candidatus Dormibacteraeota bacterium]|nr:hypothetical protein [Candidatus Dormibacteraeota bacterium]